MPAHTDLRPSIGRMVAEDVMPGYCDSLRAPFAPERLTAPTTRKS